jgi:hypothetical protein
MKAKSVTLNNILDTWPENKDETICSNCGTQMHYVANVTINAKFSDEENELEDLKEENSLHLVCFSCGHEEE